MWRDGKHGLLGQHCWHKVGGIAVTHGVFTRIHQAYTCCVCGETGPSIGPVDSVEDERTLPPQTTTPPSG